MSTKHKVIFGNCMSMEEIPDKTCHLMITSPPYFNAPFDYDGFSFYYSVHLIIQCSYFKYCNLQFYPLVNYHI